MVLPSLTTHTTNAYVLVIPYRLFRQLLSTCAFNDQTAMFLILDTASEVTDPIHANVSFPIIEATWGLRVNDLWCLSSMLMIVMDGL